MRWLFLVLVVAVSSATVLHAADATLALPLQGHYRAGRFMPVHVSAQTDSPTDSLWLRGSGALPLEIQVSNGSVDSIVPFLSIRGVSDVTWSTAAGSHAVSLPLSELDSNERLIGFAGADPDVLGKIFPDRKLVRVPLDVADPLPGDIAAWEALDGLVLDSSSAGKLTEGQIRALLAGGTAIAIRTPKAPRDNWPWRQQGAYWIAHVDIAGPTSAYAPEAYVPAQNWTRGWPASFRRAIMLIAIVFVLLVTGLTLLRSRWMTVGVVLLCAISTAGAFVWRACQSPAIEAGGTIIALTDSTTQRDDWTYHAVLREADGSFDLPLMTRPVFSGRRQAGELNVTQFRAPDGRLTIRYHLKPGQSFAFQTRTLTAGRENVNAKMPVDSPLGSIADKLYEMKDDRIVGQVDDGTEQRWPGVVVERGRDAATSTTMPVDGSR